MISALFRRGIVSSVAFKPHRCRQEVLLPLSSSRLSLHCIHYNKYISRNMSDAVETMEAEPIAKGGEENGNKKREGDQNNNHRPQNKKSKKKNNRNPKKNQTRRESEDGDGSFYNNNKSTHEGSYAHPAMREKFGVTLPPHLLPPEPTSKEEGADQMKKEGEEDEHQSKKDPRPFSKKKVAFLLAYVGSDYVGFQINNEQRTLQAEFELALLKSELLSPLNFGYPNKYGWSTSGRTDKGVHACAQVCSVKVQLLPDQTMDDVRELVNKHLPSDFKVLDVVRVTRRFCAKTGRSKVRYQYMIPSFCFYNRDQLRKLLQENAPLDKEDRHASETLSAEEVKEIQKHLVDYRVSEEQKQALQAALKQYEGTHSFHNFTKGIAPGEDRAKRYILSFNVEDPIVVDGIEWIPTQVVGQSFLLHQIRKMVSLAVDTVRFPLNDTIQRAFQRDGNVRTNLAPAQGLFLEMSFYDLYNQKKESSAVDVDELNWHTEGSPANYRWKKFRNEVIMDHVVKEEEREGNFIKYLYEQEFYFEFNQNYHLCENPENVYPAES